MSRPPKTKPRNLGEALASVVTKATGKWAATKKSEERHPSHVSYRRVRTTAARGLSQKDAAAQVMEAAYRRPWPPPPPPPPGRSCMRRGPRSRR